MSFVHGCKKESFYFRIQSSRRACNSSCKHIEEVSRLNTNRSSNIRGSHTERELGHNVSSGLGPRASKMEKNIFSHVFTTKRVE